MNNITGIADISAKLTHRDEADSYVEQASEVLTKLRKRIVEIDADWQRRRREIARRAHDELTALDAQHDQLHRRLASIAQRIEHLMED